MQVFNKYLITFDIIYNEYTFFMGLYVSGEHFTHGFSIENGEVKRHYVKFRIFTQSLNLFCLFQG